MFLQPRVAPARISSQDTLLAPVPLLDTRAQGPLHQQLAQLRNERISSSEQLVPELLFKGFTMA